jgi:carbon monoxide dehydrogenase subunit G
MPSFSSSIHINAPPTRVWHVLANAEQYDLQSADTREEITSAQRQGVGTTLRVVRRVGPLAIVLSGRVADWDEAHAMVSEWSSGLPFAVATRVQMRLTAEEGGTRLDREYRVDVRLPLVGGVAAAFLSRNTRREMQALMERIKGAAENRQGRGHLAPTANG